MRIVLILCFMLMTVSCAFAQPSGGFKLGTFEVTDTMQYSSVVTVRSIKSYGEMTGSIIKSGEVMVNGVMMQGAILEGGRLDANAIKLIKQSKGKQVTILYKYIDPSGAGKSAAMVFVAI